MKKRTKTVLSLIISLIICSIIGIAALKNPLPQEPEDIPSKSWSYYQGRPPLEVFLLKNRDAILFFLFFCLIFYDIMILIFDYRKEKKLD